MKTLAEIGKTQPKWSLEEFVEVANELLPEFLPLNKGNTRIREEINPRLVRHYTSLGLVDEPEKTTKFALYNYRQLLQILLVRRLLTEGIGASAIANLLREKNNLELETLLNGGIQLNLNPANPALAYLQEIKQRNNPETKTQRSSLSEGKNQTSWFRLEITTGLEIHLRSDFKSPTTIKEQQLLEQKILEQIKDFLQNKGKKNHETT
jgi:DNA-binding transcriptional MerR regulator